MDSQPSHLTIRELAARAAAALTAHPVGKVNGRTREIADVRTLRYYTTLGLLDRPSRWVGRTAYYGQRHLMQLVCIKRLQAKGQSLAEIQGRLLNATSDDLARLAELPADIQASPTERENQDQSNEREPARVFWKKRPIAEAAAVQSGQHNAEISDDLVGNVPLDDRVALLFAAARPPDDDDRAALRVAALPLLDVLRKRRLLT
jgi:DNA-binding transcriptional MerR regulator